jgi:ligand-binding sensor domain-containing protein
MKKKTEKKDTMSYIMLSFYTFIIIIGEVSSVFAEGKWTTYANANGINSLTLIGNDLYNSSSGGVVKWNITTGEIERLFTVSDGIESNWFNSTAADSCGNIWFATGAGVTRYNGTSYYNYKFYDPNYYNEAVSMSCIAADKKGTVWAGSSSGMVFSLTGNEWIEHLAIPYSINSSAPYPRVNAIVADEVNAVWIAVEQTGVLKYKDKQWQQFTPDDGLVSKNIKSIAVTKNNVTWFGGIGGVSKFDGTTWTTYRTSSGLANENVNSIAYDERTGYLWCATDAGFSRFDGRSWENYSKKDVYHSIYNDMVSSVIIDNNGKIWFGMKYVENNQIIQVYPGIVTFDGIQWKRMLSPGPASNYINCFAFDNDENVWVGTYKGISKYNRDLWTHYFSSPDSSHEILTLGAGNNGSVYAMSHRPYSPYSIYKYDGISWKINQAPISDESGITCSLVDKNNVFWVGTRLSGTPDNYNVVTWGIYTFNGISWDHFTSQNCGLPYDNINSMDIDNDGKIWFAYKGINEYDGVKWTHYQLSINAKFLACGHDGTIWVADTWKNTIYGIKNGGITNSYQISDYVEITALAVDHENVVWIGTKYWGLFRIMNGVVDQITTQQGLVSNRIQTIRVAPNGSIWVGTDQEISYYRNPTPVKVNETISSPAYIKINKIFPNPFNSSTLIKYSISNRDYCTINIYCISGQKIRTLVSGSMCAGAYTVSWNGCDDSGRQVSSGVYFARVESGGKAAVGKMLLMK